MANVLNLDRGSLERALRKGQKPPMVKNLWERETGRGIHHSFGEYKLNITAANGGKEDVEINEDCSMISTRVWDSAVVMIKWLEIISTQNHQHPDLAKSLELKIDPSEECPIQVLEPGAGTGLLSICLAKMGAAVISSEYGSAVRYLQKKCFDSGVTSLPQTNLKAGVVSCREIDWYNTTETLQTLFGPNERAIFDLIVVTDCSLTIKESKGVLDMIRKYGTIGHTKVVAGLCNEREGKPYFIEQCLKDFKEVVAVPTAQHHPFYRTMRQTIIQFRV